MTAQQNGHIPDQYRCDVILIQDGAETRIIINGGEIPVSNFAMDSEPGDFTKLRLTIIPTTIDMQTVDSIIQKIDWL
jgi:hypothetical protein